MQYPTLLKYKVHQTPKTAAPKINNGTSRGKITAAAVSNSKPQSSTSLYAAQLFFILSPTFHNKVSNIVA